MPVDLSSVRDTLSRYLSGTMSLREFRNWFQDNTWQLDITAIDPTFLKLYGDIQLALAEYDNGDWSEDELRQLLHPLTLQDNNRQPHTGPVPSEAISFFTQPTYDIVNVVDVKTT